MKKNNLFFAAIMLICVLTSCQSEKKTSTTLIDFEDVTLNSTGYWNGSDQSGFFNSANGIFINKGDQSGEAFYWRGFSCSSKTDIITQGYTNQYSVMAGKAALGSSQFALAYDTATVNITYTNHYNRVKSVMLTNSTYSYLAMVNGTDYSHVFSAAGDNGKGDWFKVIIKGFMGNNETGRVQYYLADFRNGKTFISKEWEKVDLSSLGQVDRLVFTFDSSDKSYGYINNPTYVCMDNIELEFSLED